MAESHQKKILIVFGTRPEAIKLAPVIRELKKSPDVETGVCVFRQHKEMLGQALEIFGIKPDFILPVSLSDKELLGQGISIIKKAVAGAKSAYGLFKYLKILKQWKPDLIIVQGDTSSAFLGAFFAFYRKIPIAHVEAGLRTYDKYAPFPEEMIRQLISRLADLHFAPTEKAKENLLREGIAENRITVTGNTGIDALLSVNKETANPEKKREMLSWFKEEYDLDVEMEKKNILVTAHRRENFGEGIEEICRAVETLAESRKDIQIIFLVHPNPHVREKIKKFAESIAKSVPVSHDRKNPVHFLDPLPYDKMVFLMKMSYIILTDSGGIQEEAPSLGKPVLVLREKTERTEGIDAGTSKLVGAKKESIAGGVKELLENAEAYRKMAETKNPYGDGRAAERTVERIRSFLFL